MLIIRGQTCIGTNIELSALANLFSLKQSRSWFGETSSCSLTLLRLVSSFSLSVSLPWRLVSRLVDIIVVVVVFVVFELTTSKQGFGTADSRHLTRQLRAEIREAASYSHSVSTKT